MDQPIPEVDDRHDPDKIYECIFKRSSSLHNDSFYFIDMEDVANIVETGPFDELGSYMSTILNKQLPGSDDLLSHIGSMSEAINKRNFYRMQGVLKKEVYFLIVAIKTSEEYKAYQHKFVHTTQQ